PGQLRGPRRDPPGRHPDEEPEGHAHPDPGPEPAPEARGRRACGRGPGRAARQRPGRDVHPRRPDHGARGREGRAQGPLAAGRGPGGDVPHRRRPHPRGRPGAGADPGRLQDDREAAGAAEAMTITQPPREMELDTEPADGLGGNGAGRGRSVLRAQALTKSYGRRVVVRTVNVDIRQGEIVGLLGPNGAGKTTTFYMVVGLTRPDSGHV